MMTEKEIELFDMYAAFIMGGFATHEGVANNRKYVAHAFNLAQMMIEERRKVLEDENAH